MATADLRLHKGLQYSIISGAHLAPTMNEIVIDNSDLQ